MLKTQNTSEVIDLRLAQKMRIAIVRTDYHKKLNDNLEKHCIATLVKNNIFLENIKTFSVPGSWEIPLITQNLAKSKKFDAIIAFGIIIKGETYHFEMLANEVGHALMQLSLEYNLPIAMEILAAYKKEQAENRAGDNEYNKGIEAAVAILKMLKILKNE